MSGGAVSGGEVSGGAVSGGAVSGGAVDESHFHRDLDLGYTWAPVGERVWRVSDCPGLSERINW